jgi:Transposase zinc-ribbon domain
MDSPKTLIEAIKLFSEPKNCRQFMIGVRWLDGVARCPTCGSDKVVYMENAKLYKMVDHG